MCKWHRARFKPTVKHFFNTFKVFTIDIKFNFINPWTMIVVEFYARKLIKFIIRTDNFYSSFITLPNWHCSCPETVTRQVPIWSLFDIFLETTMFQMFWEPVNILIFLNHEWLRASNVEEPAWECTIHNPLFRAWVEWVFVLNIFNLINDAFFFKNLRDEFICSPNFHSIFVGITHAKLMELLAHFRKIITILIEYINEVNILSCSERIVVFTISWSDVNNSSTIFIRNKFCTVYFICTFFSISFFNCFN